jgi:2-polyprenyl-3-methyl-5-hydroxy-6-metoxy-1,4-benzoquinol methylase
MKILVGIANYGTQNDDYLRRLIAEYRGMDHRVDLVVFSNLKKELGAGVELIVGLPARNPWSLPFSHKKVFAERADKYDLFLYSEDDILVSQRNIEAFLQATQALPSNEIAGFLRIEVGPDGRRYFADIHSHFHWDPASVCRRGEYTCAYFSNEHSACYLLTQKQLKQAIESGGYLTEPYESKYDMLVTAATDPYVNCGMRKMICISHLEDFLVSHLSNKYVGRMGLEESEVRLQLEALRAISRGERAPTKLLQVETTVLHQRWSKYFHESCNPEVLKLVPEAASNVLSVGCGLGLTEHALIKRGARVVGLPLDSVIARCSEAKGVNVVLSELNTVPRNFNGHRFDCILLLDVLHLLPDPVSALGSIAQLLAWGGRIVIGSPNFSYLPYVWRRTRRDPQFAKLSSYNAAGLHATTRLMVRRWFAQCGLKTEKIVNVVPERWQKLKGIFGGLTDMLFGSEMLAVGTKIQRACQHSET